MSTPDTADRIPSGIATVPGFPAVQVSFTGYNRDGTACIWYIGNHDELIAAGVATEQMLAIEAHRRRQGWMDARGEFAAVSEKRFLAELERRYGSGERPRRPSYLRLVVDNTRREGPL